MIYKKEKKEIKKKKEKAFKLVERQVGEERGKKRKISRVNLTFARPHNMFDTEKFIEEIEKRPAIYDVNRSEYNDRNAKMTAWDEVCQVMVPNWALLTDEERYAEGTQPLAIDRSGFLDSYLFDPSTNYRDYILL